jgi:hypothetical protein
MIKSKIPEILKTFKEVKDKDGNDLMVFNNFPTPLTTFENFELYMIYFSIQSIILQEESVSFPIRFNLIKDIISDPSKMNVEGIKEHILLHKEKFMNGKTFLKTHIFYSENEPLPRIQLSYIVFKDDGDLTVSSETSLFSIIYYKYDENIFTDERIKKMEEHGVNSEFIKILTNTNLCPVKFENGELLPLIEIEKYRDQFEK